MRFYYDTEFIEDGRTVDLISIGIVADDGRELYAVNEDAPWDRINEHQWLMANVVPSLPTTRSFGLVVPNAADPVVADREEIRRAVAAFLLSDADPELWAFFSSYDHLCLAQLFGTMMDFPLGLPMWTNDVRQWQHQLGVTVMPAQPGGVHNALEDARHVRTMWAHLHVKSLF